MGYYSFFVFLRQRYKQIKDPPTDYIYDAIYKIYIHKYTYTKKPHNNVAGLFCVGLPGFEPGQTEPKPVVLPLHHSPIISTFLRKRCKDTCFILYLPNFSMKNFNCNRKKLSLLKIYNLKTHEKTIYHYSFGIGLYSYTSHNSIMDARCPNFT